MRTFLICLLAVGAFAAETTKKSANKHEKRGVLTGEHSPNVYTSQQYSGYSQPQYQHALQSDSSSSYNSGLNSYSQGSLGGSFQQGSGYQTYPSGNSGNVYDNALGQSSVSQVGQSFDFPSGQQGQFGQTGYPSYNTGAVSHTSEPIHTRVVSHVVKVPVPVPRPVPVERTVPVPYPHPVPVEVPRPVSVTVRKPVPVYVNKPYPVNINRPVPVPVAQPYEVPYPVPVPVHVPHPVPVPVSHHDHHHEHHNVGHDHGLIVDNRGPYGQVNYEQQGATFHGNLANLEGLGHHGNLGGHEHVDVGNHHYDQHFGGHNTYPHGLDHSFDTSFKTHNYGPVQETSDFLHGAATHHDSGYHYEKPAKKFTF